jgi:hypothetical protein
LAGQVCDNDRVGFECFVDRDFCENLPLAGGLFAVIKSHFKARAADSVRVPDECFEGDLLILADSIEEDNPELTPLSILERKTRIRI